MYSMSIGEQARQALTDAAAAMERGRGEAEYAMRLLQAVAGDIAWRSPASERFHESTWDIAGELAGIVESFDSEAALFRTQAQYVESLPL
ncbi:hypothetical protein [Microbacterium amylolyticum]|uniref:Uncharacterized protein n=1 Tax=Microbacterium amylolyticum TaxID=936337 RepID=A0ABS4ZJ57_9MICO|nr:hypothetical protein [Microbacterium amylolyticum]MBP2436980.1 hypothetical protein [Microbacterium amylolyticum]